MAPLVVAAGAIGAGSERGNRLQDLLKLLESEWPRFAGEL
jgi:hypothetical protein